MSKFFSNIGSVIRSNIGCEFKMLELLERAGAVVDSPDKDVFALLMPE